MAVPLVTIGIPSYNRPGPLEHAVGSALAQDHSELEVIICDDASTDPAVPALTSRLAAVDPRVRVIRQPRNLGHAENYQAVLDAARGDYFMWLADDDWLDPGYVRRCLAILDADARNVLVCGQGRYYRGGSHVVDERPINLVSPRPGIRLVQYFARVSLNGPLFGVARREQLRRTGFPDEVGGDWLLVAALATRGAIRTLTDIHIHRSLEGLGGDGQRLAESFGMRGMAARQHHIVFAARLWRLIAGGAPPFDQIKRPARLSVASLIAVLVVVRFTFPALVRGVLHRDRP